VFSYVIATLLDPRFKLVPFESIHHSENSPEITPVKTISAIDAQRTHTAATKHWKADSRNIYWSKTVLVSSRSPHQRPCPKI